MRRKDQRIRKEIRNGRTSRWFLIFLPALLAAVGTAGSGPSAGTRSRGDERIVDAISPEAILRPASPRPSINGPRITGTTPGRPFLYRIPATGERPLHFSARRLPEGVGLDAHTGILRGAVRKAGTYEVELAVHGPRGRAQRGLTIVAGEKRLVLTPPMGWSSWYAWGDGIDAGRVRRAAEGMLTTGLAAHGYQYLNIDDGWMGRRDENGEMTPYRHFGESMKSLVDAIHAMGLRVGLYSSPGPQTCMGYVGSHEHERQDAATYARWGIDYLKYDWCSYRRLARDSSREELAKPYRLMRRALDAQERDIVYALCQYGMGNVWEWGAEVGGNLWRTTLDVQDTWSSISRIGFGQDGRERYAGPGRWNDPDMLLVGKLVGRRSRLTPDEQITQMSLWSLLAAPLLVSCDLSQIDPWTLALLTHDEVIAVDQDPLGRAARRIERGGRPIGSSQDTQDGALEVWARPLWDGTTAAGLFNRGETAAVVTVQWSDLGLSGSQRVRDLWRREDLGEFSGRFAARVRPHGVVLVRIGRPRRDA